MAVLDDDAANAARHPQGPGPGDPPTLTLYGRRGCGLCLETRRLVEAILETRRRAGRRVPRFVERDIEGDPDLEHRFLVEIPVVELGGRQLLLATSPGRIERLLDEVLDG